jgi:hypothetical protein
VWGESIRRPPQWGDFSLHLFGPDDHPIPNEGESLGIYPIVNRKSPSAAGVVDLLADIDSAEDLYGTNLGDAWVRWGCSDIDVGYEEGWPQAKALVQALQMLGIEAHIERTKGKGWHVWVFATNWVPALVMRMALLAAHQLADVPVVEVNPKQVDLTSTRQGLGNYVNLPYFYGAEPGKRVVVDSDQQPVDLQDFVEVAAAQATPIQTLVEAGRLYVAPPPKQQVTIHKPYEGNLRALTVKLNGLAFTIFRDGPREGMDRSDKLCQLAYYCRDAGLTPEEAYAVVADSDSRWGKFQPEGRPDAEEQLLRIVQNAYG